LHYGDRDADRALSQSVPRDGGYCNDGEELSGSALGLSQSVPRDGGYCNARCSNWASRPWRSQSVPRDGGYCNATEKLAEIFARGLNPSRGTGGTATGWIAATK